MAHVTHNNLVSILSGEDRVVFVDDAQDLRVEIHENASLKLFDVRIGSRTTNVEVKLLGRKARCEIFGLFFSKGNDKILVNHTVKHVSSHTYSNILVKGVLGGSAEAQYKGLVHVPEGSYGCEGYQQEDTLLLSPQAKVYAVPDLEIANNDVKCSHGVTTTNINKEKLFYLQSRGVSDEDAKKLVVQAHISPIIDVLPNEEIKNSILNAIVS